MATKDNARRYYLQVRVNLAEEKLAKKLAIHKGITVSEMIRQWLQIKAQDAGVK